MPPPIIYLDTSDFSRFGDVLRGKSDDATEKLFLSLETRASKGDAIFPVSMPILGELLQYDADFRETTLCKAQAVARLCGEWALAYPSRLIASEIATAARESGALPDGEPISVLSPDRFWYPDVSQSFYELRAKIQSGVDAKVDSYRFVNRKSRRGAKKIVRKFDLAKVAAEAAPEMASTYGLPASVFIRSIVAMLRGSITPEEASRRLFREIAEPVTFVKTYFERVETERTMPEWMGGLGRDFQTHLQVFRDQTRPLMGVPSMREQLANLLADWSGQLGAMALRIADGDDLAVLGLSAERRDCLAATPAFVSSVPAAAIVGRVIPEYTRQIIGLSGAEAKIENSFGGDLVHALYLPHVDLWRGDRRFAQVVMKAMPALAHHVIPTLKALPEAIDNWNLGRSSLESAPR